MEGLWKVYGLSMEHGADFGLFLVYCRYLVSF
jgi:hypothetical protein